MTRASRRAASASQSANRSRRGRSAPDAASERSKGDGACRPMVPVSDSPSSAALASTVAPPFSSEARADQVPASFACQRTASASTATVPVGRSQGPCRSAATVFTRAVTGTPPRQSGSAAGHSPTSRLVPRTDISSSSRSMSSAPRVVSVPSACVARTSVHSTRAAAHVKCPSTWSTCWPAPVNASPRRSSSTRGFASDPDSLPLALADPASEPTPGHSARATGPTSCSSAVMPPETAPDAVTMARSCASRRPASVLSEARSTRTRLPSIVSRASARPSGRGSQATRSLSADTAIRGAAAVPPNVTAASALPRTACMTAVGIARPARCSAARADARSREDTDPAPPSATRSPPRSSVSRPPARMASGETRS